MKPSVAIDVPDVSVLSYDQQDARYVDVTDNVEIVVSRSMQVSGMVTYMFRGSVSTGGRINDIALRFNEDNNISALDQFAGHVAVTAAADGAYRIYPLFLTQIEVDTHAALYLRQHAGTFTSFYADVNDIIQVHANWIS